MGQYRGGSTVDGCDMLIPGLQILLQRPHEFAERVLHPGEVVEVGDDSYTVALEAPLQLEAGQDIHAYYEHERKFVHTQTTA